MVFSRLRQNRSWSSRNCPDELAQLRDKFPTEKPEKLDQALKDANGNYLEAVQSLHATRIQTSSSPMQQHTPNKLRKPEQRQHINPYPNMGFSAADKHPYHQLMPFHADNWNDQYTGHPSPQYQSVVAPFPPHPQYPGPPQQYTAPTYIRPQPLTPVLQELRHFPNAPMPVPPFPSTFPSSPYQQQLATPWTPHQPALDWGDSRVNDAVPLYELPPPDLMEYDMGYMIAIRMLPEWSKYKEDRHWNHVRRERNAALRRELGEDRDFCTVM